MRFFRRSAPADFGKEFGAICTPRLSRSLMLGGAPVLSERYKSTTETIRVPPSTPIIEEVTIHDRSSFNFAVRLYLTVSNRRIHGALQSVYLKDKLSFVR